MGHGFHGELLNNQSVFIHENFAIFFLDRNPESTRCIINAVHKDLVSHALRMQPRKVLVVLTCCEAS